MQKKLIDRAGTCSLDASFQQVPLFQIFWNFHIIFMEHQ